MNKNQKNKLAMYDCVISTLNGNSSIASTISAFPESAEEFKTIISRIKLTDKDKDETVYGKSATKWENEDNLIDSIIKIASGMYIYARRSNNNELRELTDMTENKLRKMRDSDLLKKANSIKDAASNNLNNLGNYGINSDILKDLTEKISAFSVSINDRDSSTVEKIALKESLHKLFDSADEILKEELDNFAESLKNDYPQFYNEYQAARVIKELGIRHKKETSDHTPSNS